MGDYREANGNYSKRSSRSSKRDDLEKKPISVDSKQKSVEEKAFLDIGRDTKNGTVLGAMGMMNPASPSIYLYYRNRGQDRNEALNSTFKLNYKIATYALKYAGPEGAAASDALKALDKPVNTWSDKEVSDFLSIVELVNKNKKSREAAQFYADKAFFEIGNQVGSV